MAIGSLMHDLPLGESFRTYALLTIGDGLVAQIPALLLSASFRRSGVDHTVMDTTSIIATLERSLGLDPVGIRDTEVNDLGNAVRIGRPGRGHHHGHR